MIFDAGGDQPLHLANERLRYNFGITEAEFSGEKACKRRPAKHLDFLPPLLEGRRSFQLSYGRLIDSKRFRAFATIHLLPFVSNRVNHAILRQFLVATLPQELTALLGWFHTPELSLKTP
jgi:hypothetical protein